MPFAPRIVALFHQRANATFCVGVTAPGAPAICGCKGRSIRPHCSEACSGAASADACPVSAAILRSRAIARVRGAARASRVFAGAARTRAAVRSIRVIAISPSRVRLATAVSKARRLLATPYESSANAVAIKARERPSLFWLGNHSANWKACTKLPYSILLEAISSACQSEAPNERAPSTATWVSLRRITKQVM